MNSNLQSALLKLTALAGGAVLGAILDYWIEETLAQRSQERSLQDKQRYGQGLPQQDSEGRRAIYEIHTEREEPPFI
ncbi:MAG TPA: hypothetical protein VFN23_05160 [Ktedonobacteraceae bacterium]|nr:hypothetical protein [Ktedonobacteraceae bacterium]